jgi:hypothetical protein
MVVANDSLNGVYVLLALAFDLGHFPGCITSHILFFGPAEDFTSPVTAFR